MTWSIIALDPDTRAVGVAVSSRFFAVGAMVPNVASGVGAACSQALINPYLGSRALDLLRAGVPPRVALDALIDAEPDPGRQHRQLHVLGIDGTVAAYTGPLCVEYAGQRAQAGVSVAGNMLSGPEVLDATLDAFTAGAGRPLPERLLRALTAGERAGGDKRGKQAAGLVVYGTEDYADLDLRCDDHPDPIGELWRLYQVAHERHLAFRVGVPTRAQPEGVHDRAELERRIEAWIARHGNVDFTEFWSRDPWK